jgi:hypothetical protein
MNDFDDDLEHELHASRPAPRGELLDSLVTKIGARPAPVRRSKWQLRLAATLSIAALVGLAGLGGVSVASNAISHSASHARGHEEHGDQGKHGGKPEPDGKKDVEVCLNGATSSLFFEWKKANKLVNIQHRGVYGHCPAP